jgi:septin family protein
MKARLIAFAVVASSDTNQEEQEKEKVREMPHGIS